MKYLIKSGVFAALVSLVFSSTISAQERPAEPEDSLTRDAIEYVDEFGTSLDSAKFRLGIQAEIGDLHNILQLEEKTDYAGLYIQHEPVYHIFVLYKHHKNKAGNKGKKTFNGRLNSRLAKTKWRSFVKLRKVDNTLAELEAYQDDVVRIINGLDIDGDTSINIEKNIVELSVLNIEALTMKLADSGLVLPQATLVSEVEQLALTNSIYGGLPISTCTVGFGVQNSSGTKGIVTAAHCSNTQSFDGTNLPYQSGIYSGTTDMQWHTAPGITVENDVRTCSLFGVTCGWRNMTGTVSRSSQAVGTQVCKYGKTTGYGCGLITSTSHRPSYVPGATATYVTVAKNGNTLTAGGDSGGPWFSGNNAYGVHSGGSSTYSIYTPINYLSNLGLNILTK